LWGNKKYAEVDLLLDKFKEQFGIPEIHRAVQILDSPRKCKTLTNKLAALQQRPKPPATAISNLRSQISDIKRDMVETTSLSGALSRRICRFLSTISASDLTFYALQMPKEPWQDLADVLHLKPSHLQCDWFLDVVFGKSAPPLSLYSLCKSITVNNVVEILQQDHQIPYSFLRTHVRPLPAEAKALVARYSSLDTLVWWHEEIESPEVDRIIYRRLQDGEITKLPYGKVVERLLYFRRKGVCFYNLMVPIAQKQLEEIELLLEPPVVVLGDGSFSMDVAIRTATIISSVLTVLSGAELKFFNVVTVDPPCYPTNVEEVVDVAERVVAAGMTAPAAALQPYYAKNKVVKFFVVVTDEIENNKFEDRIYFPELFLKYYQEVYPAKLIFVSFLEDPSRQGGGRMVNSVRNMGIDVLQFRLDANRPDLTKLDTLLGLLSSESSFFPQHVQTISEIFTEGGLPAALDRLNHPPSKEGKRVQVEDSDTSEEEKERKVDKDDVPDHLCCPILLSLMEDPVITPAGHSYSRKALEAAIAKTGRDPLTQEPLSLNDLRPNRSLKEAIEAYLEGKKG